MGRTFEAYSSREIQAYGVQEHETHEIHHRRVKNTRVDRCENVHSSGVDRCQKLLDPLRMDENK